MILPFFLPPLEELFLTSAVLSTLVTSLEVAISKSVVEFMISRLMYRVARLELLVITPQATMNITNTNPKPLRRETTIA